jgi:mRNA interferase MazF
MKRGEIWTVSGTGFYTRKPRPAVIVQDDRFDTIDSIVICAFTTNQTVAPFFRIPVQPSEENGLDRACGLMVDKIIAVPKTKLGRRLGMLDHTDMARLSQAIVMFLGLAGAA